MREGFAAAVAGGRHTGEPRIQTILHVTLENAIFDQYGTLRRIAFIIDIQ